MLFNSYEFIFAFLPLTMLIYFYLNSKKLTEASKGFLVFSSLFFYSWWNVLYLPLILMSILFNYIIGGILSKSTEKKAFKKTALIFGVFVNLLLLGYFKYTDFFIENLNIVFSLNMELMNLMLPLAISFFTFQQVAYLVDCYREEVKERDFLNYTVFVTFFPQLIAGPIVHHKEMMPQFSGIKSKVINYKNISMGLFVFSIGLFKKVVIADTFAVWATAGFDTSTTLSLVEAWVTSLSYTFQLYFDFSGYTDMAIGLALLFNIKLPINFYSPYKAINIQDFWRRWHITLSRFLKDYIYIPLGGNRKGDLRTYNNLMATFLLAGMWHGAGWSFVFWGFLHGVALVVHRLWGKLGFQLWRWIGWLITFNFINITWIFFRAEEWADAYKVLSSMFDLSNIVLPAFIMDGFSVLNGYGIQSSLNLVSIDAEWYTVVFLFVAILGIFSKNSLELKKDFKPDMVYLSVTVLLFSCSVLFLNRYSEFLYFRF